MGFLIFSCYTKNERRQHITDGGGSVLALTRLYMGCLTITLEKSSHISVKKNNIIMGHLPLGKNGRFVKTIFYFLRADTYAECNIIITGIKDNLGDGEGMQVPWLFEITGTKNLLEILKSKLFKNS